MTFYDFMECERPERGLHYKNISLIITIDISVSYQLFLQLFQNHGIFHDTCHDISLSCRWRGTGLTVHFLRTQNVNWTTQTFRRCPGRLLNVPAGNYMFEVNNRNIRPRSKVCSQLAIETYSKPCSTMAQVYSCKFPKFLKAPEHEYIFSGIF